MAGVNAFNGNEVIIECFAWSGYPNNHQNLRLEFKNNTTDHTRIF